MSYTRRPSVYVERIFTPGIGGRWDAWTWAGHQAVTVARTVDRVALIEQLRSTGYAVVPVGRQ